MVGQIRPSGWDEEWLWVNGEGQTYSMPIAFSVGVPAEGTVWNIGRGGK